MRITLLLAMLISLVSCQKSQATTSEDTDRASTPTSPQKSQAMTQSNPNDSNDVLVDIKTTMGDIRIRLFGDTPAHRDNFVKLVNQGYYNGVLFHRVISDFMIQTGDPDSKTAAKGQQLGSGGPGYTLEAEIQFPKHFHQRGALAAARTGDQINPERRSSGSQFYIVTGQTYSAAQLDRMESQLRQAQMQGIFNQLATERMDQIRQMQAAGDSQGLQKLQEELIAITESKVDPNAPVLTPEMRQAYSTVGGAPHLDGQYTVFGQVESGMDVVDKIEKVATDRSDRPVDDVKIISMTIVK